MNATIQWPSVRDVEDLYDLSLLACENAKRLCAVALRVQHAAYERGTLDDMKHADAMVKASFDQYARASAQQL